MVTFPSEKDLKKWQPMMDFELSPARIVPVWIKLPKLPADFLKEERMHAS